MLETGNDYKMVKQETDEELDSSQGSPTGTPLRRGSWDSAVQAAQAVHLSPRRKLTAVVGFALGALLVGASWLGSSSPSSPFSSLYTCPSPLSPRSDALIPPRHQSEPLTLPSAHPDFSVSLTYDTTVCNSFDVLISRLDKGRCAEAETGPAPTNNSAYLDWIHTRLGPDSFDLQVDGAERLVEDVPTAYLGNCDYVFRFRLQNAGRVWLNASILYEDYAGVRERVVKRGAWPKDLPLLQLPLTPAPVELDICSPTCRSYLPTPPEGRKEPILPPSSPAAVYAEQRAALPTCGEAARAGTFDGAYLPASPASLLHPHYRETLAESHTRFVGGYSTFVPLGCEWRHAGRRFSSHESCIEKEHKLMMIGDSHSRVLWDVVSNRLSGSKERILHSLKLEAKDAQHGGLSMKFTFDPYLKTNWTCDGLGSYDTVAVSTGTWQTAFDCAPADDFFPQFEDMFSTWPRLAQQCGRPTPTKLIFLDIPAFPPQHKSPDCRTLPRVRYFNDRLNAMARENGWEVVDVYKLAKPVAVDMTLTDGIHYTHTDATDAAADELIDRLEICADSA